MTNKPEEQVEKKKRESMLPVEVNEDEFIALMQATTKMHHKIAFLLAWESGLRISEVINLKHTLSLKG